MSRRPRFLSAEERRLWAEVALGVQPLANAGNRGGPDRPPTAVLPVSTASPPPGSSEATPVPTPRAPNESGPSEKPVHSAKPALAPLAPIDRRSLRALSRGRRAIEGVLDLHGLFQGEAHGALRRFLAGSQVAGRGTVLVITGKGGPGGAAVTERGVLRRLVPLWLGLPDLRGLVLGFEEAAPHHGGAGALYVRLRRRGAP